jgi:hypothetical protein
LALIIVKPDPVIVAELIVTGDVPVDVKVNDCVVAVFTVTLPKLKLPALTLNCGLGAATPVPLKATRAVAPVVELLLIVSWPLVCPGVVGSNTTCNVRDWVGFNVTGKLPPAIANPAPLIAAELTVTGAVPVDVNVKDCVVAVFTVTFPKLKLVALTVSCALVWGFNAVAPVPASVTTVALPLAESLPIVI